MNSAVQRLLFEAGATAANYQFAPNREAAAREVAALIMEDLVSAGEAISRLLCAVRETAIALAIVSPETRSKLAPAIRSLVEATRCERKLAATKAAPIEPRMYWTETDR